MHCTTKKKRHVKNDAFAPNIKHLKNDSDNCPGLVIKVQV